MAEVTTVNVSFDKKEMYDLYKVKIKNKWTWEKLILEQNKFYLLHNPIEEEE